jgi:hypothetical protein
LRLVFAGNAPAILAKVGNVDDLAMRTGQLVSLLAQQHGR